MTTENTEPRSATIIIEVVAGLFPGKDPDPDYTQRYAVFADDWAEAKKDPTGLTLGRLLAETNGRAIGYAQYLMMQPDRVNWVRTDWVFV